MRLISASPNDRREVQLKNYLAMSLCKYDDSINFEDIGESLSEHDELRVEKQVDEILEFFNHFPNELFKKQYLTQIDSLFQQIIDLHKELEIRDALMRIYKDDFEIRRDEIIKDKVLYDEREWRSIKWIDVHERSIDIYNQSLDDGHLPLEDNLIFGEEDIIAILVVDEKVKNAVISYATKNKTLVSPSFVTKNIFTVNEFLE